MSNYLALADFKNAWMFNRNDVGVSGDDKALIKPMTEFRATQLWKQLISKQVDHPDFFKKGDWPFNVTNWQESGDWEALFDSEHASLPEQILEHLDWDENTVVYYCVDQKTVIETQWAVFKRCWKAFLFMDDGSLLVGKKRQQAVQFLSNGTFQIGVRSAL
ncbi:DUF2947 family protein [Paraferrimonas haliotis]|uniref:DUF2947 family protein n=1 Tax=Paraferrimonas haliotis TaxID=2013866 RepID=A0AA37WXZ7_9GAMM|nr:DUF2947 family protein [Paraferrimonas haliotis]GLS83210.1 hypothetical protein GCM10007894_11870 [Paraferrimonas haliotis]